MGMPWWVWLLTTIIGGVSVGYAITKARIGHDWKTCQCVDCRKRRYHAHKRQGHHAVGVGSDGDLIWSDRPPARRGDKRGWLSTVQLEPRMVVRVNGLAYRVTNVRTDTMGYLVELQRMGGDRRRLPIVSTVSFANADQKYWEPVR